MKNKVILVAFLNICNLTAFSQVGVKEVAKQINIQKTANTKDILTTLFRAGLDNLLGNKHMFTFSSSFFGIDSIFRTSDEPLGYERERKLRQKSVNIDLTADSNNSITKISGGLTVTLINKRDISKKLDDADLTKLYSMGKFLAALKQEINKHIAANHAQEFGIDSIKIEIQKSWTAADRKNDFSDLHPFIIEALRAGIADRIISAGEVTGFYSDVEIKEFVISVAEGKDLYHALYIDIAEKYSTKPLWTFSPKFTYDRINKQGLYSFESNLVFGLTKKASKRPWEFEVKSMLKIENDSSVSKTNYRYKPFSVSIGLNKILLRNEEKESKMELKFFTQYDYQFGSVPMGQQTGLFTLNSTFRVNLFQSLWLPVSLKYDPENHNFLGVFSITANIGN